jgi:meso-butanediol dehydrogenase / (S,S)-butanediol dehydrogenase / diacetyl reductase
MPERLAGRSVLITGAASGIGAACARRLAEEGAELLLVDLNGEGAEALARELGSGASSIQADVTRSEDIRRMVEAAYQRWGRLDVAFNNAGIGQARPFLELTEAEWDRMLNVNLRSVFFSMQAIATRMIHQEPMSGSELRGKLIQTASIAIYRGGQPMMAHYSASKAGVASITRTAAQVLAPYAVTSNAICPGVVDTPLWKKLDEDIAEIEGIPVGEAWRRRIAFIPMGRPETPEDVAPLVAFLASRDSDYLTGQAINVDGGLVMGT